MSAAVSSETSSSTASASSNILSQIKESEKSTIEKLKVVKDLEKEVNELTSTKENLIKQMDDNIKVLSAGQAEHQELQKDLDVVKVSLLAAKEMLGKRKKEEERGTKQRIDLLREMTRVVDVEAELTNKVIFEVGPFASEQALDKRLKENKEECREKLESLSRVLQEKLQYKKMIEEKNILSLEMDQTERDLKDTEETAEQLKEEVAEVKRKLNVLRTRKETDNRIPDLKQEVRELKVKLSNMNQVGKRPTVRFDVLEGKVTVKANKKQDCSIESEDLQQSLNFQTPTLVRKFVFKRK